MKTPIIMIFDRNSNLIHKERFTDYRDTLENLHKRAGLLVDNPNLISPNEKCRPAYYQIVRSV